MSLGTRHLQPPLGSWHLLSSSSDLLRWALQERSPSHLGPGKRAPLLSACLSSTPAERVGALGPQPLFITRDCGNLMTHKSRVMKSQRYVFLAQNDPQDKVTRETGAGVLSRCQVPRAAYFEGMSLSYPVTPTVHVIQVLERIFAQPGRCKAQRWLLEG